MVIVSVALLAMSILASGCYVNQFELAAVDKLAPTAPTSHPVTWAGVRYGPADNQRLSILTPDVPAVGVIIWLHGGGWCCGEQTDIDPLVLDAMDMGYAVIGVDYRRAPANRLDAIAGDVDRAVRFVKAHRAEWGLGVGKIIIGGGSAGGHLALLHAAAAGYFVDPTLPGALATVDPHVDGVISFVGPSDLRDYIEGRIPNVWLDGQVLVERLLGCARRSAMDDVTDRPYPTCTDPQILRGSPLFWALLHAYFASPLPPAYLAYGMRDQLVPPDSQGEPLGRIWQLSTGVLGTWVDLPPEGGHNLSFDVNRTAFRIWLWLFASP